MADIESLSDDELVARLRAGGSEEPFAELFRRHRGAIRARCLRMLRDRAAADELTQQIFLTAFSKFALFDGGNFKAWLLCIARNTCLNYLRLPDPPGPLPPDIPVDPSPADVLRDQRVRATLGQLTPPQRVALKLFYIEGYSYREIAAITGGEERDVKTHLQNGRKRFQAIWQRGDGRDGGSR